MRKSHICQCGKPAQRGLICYACRKAAYRKKYPLQAAYRELRYGALRRGKEFSLTFEQYKEFVILTDYYKNKGTKSTSLHIDRKDETKGYSLNNLQVLTNAENTRKYRKFKLRDRDGKVQFEVITVKPTEQKDCPF